MLLEEGAEEQAEVLDEVLLVVLPVGVGQPDVGVQGQHLRRGGRSSFTLGTSPPPDPQLKESVRN